MYYVVRHTTRFRYSEPVTESAMEIRMQPRTDTGQHCLNFELRVNPRALVFSYNDLQQNRVHFFDIPDQHRSLSIRTDCVVEVDAPPETPMALAPDDWERLDAETRNDQYWDWLEPSTIAHSTEASEALAQELGIQRGPDPLTTVRDLATLLHDVFAYDMASTDVDSPIDAAIGARRGVCQDFSHIMIVLARQLGIPARYVSGYLYQRTGQAHRTTPDATHAWVEVLLPGLGWRGFDPTNNVETGERHIRVALGRDYSDVPPTRGVFKGRATTELAVAVRVAPTEAPEIEHPADEESEPVFRPTYDQNEQAETDLQTQPQQ